MEREIGSYGVVCGVESGDEDPKRGLTHEGFLDGRCMNQEDEKSGTQQLQAVSTTAPPPIRPQRSQDNHNNNSVPVP